MKPYLGPVIVWLIAGAFAGTLAGTAGDLQERGVGRWTNLGVGLVER